MKKGFVFGVLILALMVSSAPLFAQAAERSYYVSDKGDDSNNGRREDAPFKTLQKAVDSASAGVVKTITIIGPLYYQLVAIKNAGTDEILITGKVDASNKPRFLGDAFRITIDETSTIRIENIEFIRMGLQAGSRDDESKRGIVNRGTLIVGTGVVGACIENEGTCTIQSNAKVFQIINKSQPMMTWMKEDPPSGTVVMKDTASVVSWDVNGQLKSSRVIGVTNSGTFIMQDNSKITEITVRHVKESAAGVHNLGGTFTMKDNAEISNNTTNEPPTDGSWDSWSAGDSWNAGGVANRGVFIMQGNAKITGNEAKTSNGKGGGVYCYDGGNLTIKENAIISGNKATKGGGVFIDDAGVTVEDKTQIVSNTAKEGGGIYVVQGSFRLTDINGKWVRGFGTVQESYRRDAKMWTKEQIIPRTKIEVIPGFTLTGGTITGNKAEYGAGVYAEKNISNNDLGKAVACVAFLLNGGSVTGNEADFVGGGLYLLNKGAFTQGKGTITGNTAGDGEGEDIYIKQ